MPPHCGFKVTTMVPNQLNYGYTNCNNIRQRLFNCLLLELIIRQDNFLMNKTHQSVINGLKQFQRKVEDHRL